MLMIGTGEVRVAGCEARCTPRHQSYCHTANPRHTVQYTTGYGANSAKTDKGAGVVALTLVDLRRRGAVGDLHLAGVSGIKLPAIRAHMARAIGAAYPASAFDLRMTTYPDDATVDATAYMAALAAMPPGSAATVFTPVRVRLAWLLAVCCLGVVHLQRTRCTLAIGCAGRHAL